jgi:hypothetical protein
MIETHIFDHLVDRVQLALLTLYDEMLPISNRPDAATDVLGKQNLPNLRATMLMRAPFDKLRANGLDAGEPRRLSTVVGWASFVCPTSLYARANSAKCTHR